MCCCDKPTINGEFGYKWNEPNKPAMTRPVNPPAITDTDILLFDEPGRCGGQDSHSFHYRVVSTKGLYDYRLLVRHGGGDESFRISNGRPVAEALKLLDSNGRYWLLNAMFHACSDSNEVGRSDAVRRYQSAFAEGRLKKRKVRGGDHVKIWIEPRKIESAVTAQGA